MCRTLSCALKGAERVTEEIGATARHPAGRDRQDGTFTLFEVECLGACDRAPVVMVNDGWHECLQPDDAVGSSTASARRRGGCRGVITGGK